MIRKNITRCPNNFRKKCVNLETGLTKDSERECPVGYKKYCVSKDYKDQLLLILMTMVKYYQAKLEKNGIAYNTRLIELKKKLIEGSADTILFDDLDDVERELIKDAGSDESRYFSERVALEDQNKQIMKNFDEQKKQILNDYEKEKRALIKEKGEDCKKEKDELEKKYKAKAEKTVAEYETKIKAMEDKFDNLNREVKKGGRVDDKLLKSYQNDKKEYESVIKKLRGQIEDLEKQQKNNMSTKEREFQDEIKALKKELANKDKETAKELSAMKRDDVAYDKTLAQTKKELLVAEKEIQQLKLQLADKDSKLEKEASECKINYSKLEKKMAEMEKEYKDKLFKLTTDKDSKFDKMKSKYDNLLEGEKKDKEQKLRQADMSCSSKLDSVEKSKENAINTATAKLNKEIDSLQSEINGYIETVSLMNEDKDVSDANLKQIKEDCKTEIARLTQLIDDSEKYRNQSASDVEKYRLVIANLETQVADIDAELLDSKNTIKNFTEGFEVVSTRGEALEKENSELMVNIEELEKIISDAQKENKKVGALESRVQNLQRRLNDEIDNTRRLESRNKDLEELLKEERI